MLIELQTKNVRHKTDEEEGNRTRKRQKTSLDPLSETIILTSPKLKSFLPVFPPSPISANDSRKDVALGESCKDFEVESMNLHFIFLFS
jgi:hypothetical protein